MYLFLGKYFYFFISRALTTIFDDVANYAPLHAITFRKIKRAAICSLYNLQLLKN